MTRSRLLSLLLIVVIGLSAIGYGVALGSAPAAGKMVICTGQGVITVTVDAEGKPSESHTLCPDAALAHFAATPQAPLRPLPPSEKLAWRDWPQNAQGRLERAVPTRGARGPPA